MLSFHVIYVPDTILPSIPDYFANTDLNITSKHAIEFVPFEPALIKEEIVVHTDSGIVGNLASPANFARFYLHDLLPALKRVIYIDADMIVQGDVSLLWNAPLDHGHIMAAVPRDQPSYGTFFSSRVAELCQIRYRRALDVNAVTFNAGWYIWDNW